MTKKMLKASPVWKKASSLECGLGFMWELKRQAPSRTKKGGWVDLSFDFAIFLFKTNGHVGLNVKSAKNHFSFEESVS